MAPVAGMLKERGFQVTGSDVNVYPPASTLLDSLGIVWNDGYRAENLQPAPDLTIVGNIIARGNPEMEYLLNEKLPYCSMPQLLERDSFRATLRSSSPARTAKPQRPRSLRGFFIPRAGVQIF